MQSVSSRVWTRVGVSISYDDTITPQAPCLLRIIIIIISIIIIGYLKLY